MTSVAPLQEPRCVARCWRKQSQFEGQRGLRHVPQGDAVFLWESQRFFERRDQ